MAARLPVYRTCKAPKPFGSPCGHRLEGTAQTCDAHRDVDPLRQCATELPRAGGRVTCAAWPMAGLPFCSAHDPVAVALRREEQQAAHIQGRILDYLVTERRVELSAVERAVRAYWVLG